LGFLRGRHETMASSSVRLLETNAKPILFSPHHTARVLRVVAPDHQSEVIWNSE
jgi:hypothetical protein